MLETYIKENINQYKIDSNGYADLSDYDPEDEFRVMASHDDNLLDEVLSHHIDDLKKLQVDIVKTMYGDWQANIRVFSAFKKGFKSYLSRQMDSLSHDELLQKWLDEYADEYARSAAIDAQIESRMMEEL